MSDAGTNEDGECVLQVLGDGGESLNTSGAGQRDTVTTAVPSRIDGRPEDGIFQRIALGMGV